MKNNQTWLAATLKSLVDAERMTEYERTNILGIDTVIRKRVEELEAELQQEETDSDHYCELVLKYSTALEEIIQYAIDTIKPESLSKVKSYVIATTAIASSKPTSCSECADTGYEYQNVQHPPMIPCRKCGTKEEVPETQYTSIVMDGEKER